jgi:hypothetical protein
MTGRKITGPIHRTAGLPGEIIEHTLPYPSEKTTPGMMKC